MVSIGTEYLAAGANRQPAAADWDPVVGVVFGAGRNIAFWNPQDPRDKGIKALLGGHSGDVNAVRFLSRPKQAGPLLLSGSADTTLRVWDGSFASTNNVRCAGILEGHSGAINCIATLSEKRLAVSGAADGTLKVWRILNQDEEIELSLLQTINLQPRFFALDIALHKAPRGDSSLLAVGGTKNFIQIYAVSFEADTTQLSHKSTLFGHEGWIRSLDFVSEYSDQNSNLLLASASQDKYIRLWRIEQSGSDCPEEDPISSDIITRDSQLFNKAYNFNTNIHQFSVRFEALLVGHEDWILTARWDRSMKSIRLLTASADNSLAIWEPEVSSGIWVCTTRLGEVSAQKGSTTATGSIGGFWAGLWSPNSMSVLSLGRTGSWRRWVFEPEHETWTQVYGLGGHTKMVTDLAWSADGGYVLSVSADQTTRMHAPWLSGNHKTWHEIARPQIHGYDINCVSIVNSSQFVSGGEEKLLRVFDQPRLIAEMLKKFSGKIVLYGQQLPEIADIPVLGLSNKARETTERLHSYDDLRSDQEGLVHFNLPPQEDDLARHTLWPEREKLYGHGFEISALACSHDGKLIATACKASSYEHAAIRLYSVSDWREIKPALKAHSLTVTGLRFSYDDCCLLSVGRDRQWYCFARASLDMESMEMLACNPKAHTRMILGAAWAHNLSYRTFATASRDKTIKIWSKDGDSFSARHTISIDFAVTDIDFCPSVQGGKHILAAGLESGGIMLYTIDFERWQVEKCFNFEQSLIPGLAITRVLWRPRPTEVNTQDENSEMITQSLAVASEDHSTRIFMVQL